MFQSQNNTKPIITIPSAFFIDLFIWEHKTIELRNRSEGGAAPRVGHPADDALTLLTTSPKLKER